MGGSDIGFWGFGVLGFMWPVLCLRLGFCDEKRFRFRRRFQVYNEVLPKIMGL